MQTLGKGSLAWWLKLLLDVLWWIFALIICVVLLVMIAGLISGPDSQLNVDLNVQFNLDDAAYDIRPAESGVSEATIKKATGQLNFKTRFFTPFFAWWLIQLGVALVILYQLRKLFAALAAKAPFELSNAKRVRFIAVTILVAQALGALMSVVYTRQLRETFVTQGLTITPTWNFNLGVIILALMLLVIAEVFRIGAEMKAEQDLTV